MPDSCVCCGRYVPEGRMVCPLGAVGIIPGVDKKSAIHIFLREYHRGKENAIHSKELQRIFATDGRDIRRKISSLRQDGVSNARTGLLFHLYFRRLLMWM